MLKEDVFSAGGELAPELSQHFHIPQHLLSNVYRRSNGFFSFDESRDQQGQLQSCSKQGVPRAALLLTAS